MTPNITGDSEFSLKSVLYGVFLNPPHTNFPSKYYMKILENQRYKMEQKKAISIKKYLKTCTCNICIF